ncbi:hypothetical protein BRADI_3g19112v3 [Brachypodium distachyon]|uniref:Uncharacterized protein n=1 Tax=Brachypodium distachyon TaxID=15368 RepID=A0A0Q3HQM3_BRADI|nr:hypothetical protein BRADI_3g19112v3 [Brachypodium distachyon]KQJ95803.1 hypothetical protein BRADI_3g19112v3 [Brachypodium distachyon]
MRYCTCTCLVIGMRLDLGRLRGQCCITVHILHIHHGLGRHTASNLFLNLGLSQHLLVLHKRLSRNSSLLILFR